MGDTGVIAGEGRFLALQSALEARAPMPEGGGPIDADGDLRTILWTSVDGVAWEPYEVDVSTGNLPATLDGLARLAPKDSKLRAVGDGLAAASRGDIAGTLGAIADLGGEGSRVGRVAARLETAAKALELVR